MPAGALIVLVTAPSVKQARAIGRRVVEKRLAACANVIPNLHSIFTWKGKLCRQAEALILFKTTRARYAALEREIKAMHSYTVPEVIAVPIVRGSKAYLSWVLDSTRENSVRMK